MLAIILEKLEQEQFLREKHLLSEALTIKRTEELERTGARLMESENRYQTYIDNAPVGVFVVNSEGRYLEVNRAACEMTGFSENELLSMTVRDLLSPQDHEQGMIGFMKLVKTGQLRSEDECTRKDGSPLWLSLVAVRLTSSNFIGFALDITDQKLMEEQLRQGEKLQAIGQLAGGIALDFNNQIQGILGSADLLSYKLSAREDLLQLVEAIATAAERSAQITGQLLAFSRTAPIAKEPVDTHLLIREAVSLISRTIPANILTELQLNAVNPTVSGDAGQLENVLVNLAINARDAMPTGGTITFTTELVTIAGDNATDKDLAPGTCIRIAVADTGNGMDEATRVKIFEPFFTTKPSGKGTGMGLAASYGTVLRHNGAIIAHSTPGEGTSMEVFLPSLTVTSPTTELCEDPGSPPSAGEKHILAVDDDTVICEVLPQMLTTMGYRATIFSNPHEAVDYYRTSWRNVDAVILDMTMPCMDGVETLAAMREIDPQVLAIISSGHRADIQDTDPREFGFAASLHKPYRTRELGQVLGSVLQ